MGKPKAPNPLHDHWNRMLSDAKEGNLELLADLFGQITPHLRGQLRKLLGHQPRVEIDDLLQDTFLAVAKARIKFNPALGSAYGWIWTICRNLALTKLRTPAGRRQVSFEALPETVIADPRQKDPADRLLRIDEAAENWARIEAARDNLECQPEKARLAIEYRLAGHSYKLTATLLDVPVGTVATWVKRWRDGLE